MILFAKSKTEADFKALPSKTDPRLAACLLQLSALRDDLDFILTSSIRTGKAATGFKVAIRRRIDQEEADQTEKERIGSYLQFWWGDLFDFVITDTSARLEISESFKKDFG